MSEEIEREFYKLICYMVVSARNLIDETKMYGPFRLLDAGSRLITILDQEGKSSPILSQIKERIEENKYKVMTDQKQFLQALDGMILELVDNMDKQL